jgi:hypothetical protein
MTHISEEMLTSYVTGTAGTAGTAEVWSVEAHLTGCASCRSAVAAHVDAGRLARNRSVLLVRAAIGDGGPLRRLLRRCGIPDYLLGVLSATPSLRASWLLSVLAVVGVTAAEAAAVSYDWFWSGPEQLPGHVSPEALAPFLLLAPLLVLAGVAAAFLPMFDPAWRLSAAAPFSGFTLLLIRAVSALVVALIPVTGVAFALPGPGWLPFALLLPSLALSAFALAAATVMDPRAAAVVAGLAWLVPGFWLVLARVPLLVVAPGAQFASGAVLFACAVLVYLRHSRFEMGWMR